MSKLMCVSPSVNCPDSPSFCLTKNGNPLWFGNFCWRKNGLPLCFGDYANTSYSIHKSRIETRSVLLSTKYGMLHTNPIVNWRRTSYRGASGLVYIYSPKAKWSIRYSVESPIFLHYKHVYVKYLKWDDVIGLLGCRAPKYGYIPRSLGDFLSFHSRKSLANSGI